MRKPVVAKQPEDIDCQQKKSNFCVTFASGKVGNRVKIYN